MSVPTAERSFSPLRHLKTWTRSTKKEERLSGLALMHVHRDIDVDIEKVITTLAQISQNKTRLDFVL